MCSVALLGKGMVGSIASGGCDVLCCVVLRCVALRCVVLRCVALRCVVLCCVVLCCARPLHISLAQSKHDQGLCTPCSLEVSVVSLRDGMVQPVESNCSCSDR